MSCYKKRKYCILLSEYCFTFKISVDPDEMQHNAAFHLGLHCLQKYSFLGGVYPNTSLSGPFLIIDSSLLVIDLHIILSAFVFCWV